LTVEEREGWARVCSGAPWEEIVGYSRAVRCGPWVVVTGTVGRNPDGTYPPTAAEQTRRALAIIEASLGALGARREQVIRTRIFVTDITRWREIGEVHGEIFGEIRPATTMVEVRRLIDDDALVEIEAEALLLARGTESEERL
jgi:enamine deaminase RidA (YjgF/YER057c/UK114 family)